MIAKLKALWASLPHPVQAIITAFVGGFVAAAGHYFSEPNVCFSWACLHHIIPTFIAAGVVTARAFYMLPNGAGKPPENPPAASA